MKMSPLNNYTARRHNLRFCKTPKTKIDANRFAAETVCKTVLRKISKAQFMTVVRIFIFT